MDAAAGIYYDGLSLGRVKISPVAQVIGSWRGRDNGSDAQSRRFRLPACAVSPGIEFHLHPVKVYADVEIPVYQNMHRQPIGRSGIVQIERELYVLKMPSEPDTSKTSDQRKDEKLSSSSSLRWRLSLASAVGLPPPPFRSMTNCTAFCPTRNGMLGEFSLTDETGRTVTRAELDGKILAVSFLFTSCSLTCPEVSRRMAEIQQLTANDADVRLVSLTVDPRSDTPPVLAKWGARFGADTNRWFFLTGSKTVLHGLIGKSFLAQDNGDPFNSMPGNFTGTERIAVVDRHGRTRIYFDGLRDETPAAVVAEIAQLAK